MTRGLYMPDEWEVIITVFNKLDVEKYCRTFDRSQPPAANNEIWVRFHNEFKMECNLRGVVSRSERSPGALRNRFVITKNGTPPLKILKKAARGILNGNPRMEFNYVKYTKMLTKHATQRQLEMFSEFDYDMSIIARVPNAIHLLNKKRKITEETPQSNKRVQSNVTTKDELVVSTEENDAMLSILSHTLPTAFDIDELKRLNPEIFQTPNGQQSNVTMDSLFSIV